MWTVIPRRKLGVLEWTFHVPLIGYSLRFFLPPPYREKVKLPNNQQNILLLLFIPKDLFHSFPSSKLKGSTFLNLFLATPPSKRASSAQLFTFLRKVFHFYDNDIISPTFTLRILYQSSYSLYIYFFRLIKLSTS